jgi:hypothetical protein
VQQFLSKEFLSALQDLHVGRVLEKEYNAVVATIPAQSKPPSVWTDYFKSTFQPFIDKVKASKQQELGVQTGQPQASLPPVPVDATPAGVKAPGTSKVAQGIYATPADAAGLAPGTMFQIAPGKWRTRQ